MTALPTERATLLDDYRVAREAGEVAREGRDYGYPTERAMQRSDGAPQPVTLKDWIRQAQRPLPGPDDAAAVRAAELTRLLDSHSTAEEDRERADHSSRERGLVFAELVAAGWSLAEVGRPLGISKAAVHKAMGRALAAPAGPSL